MTKFTDNLWRDIAREHGPALEQAGGPGHGRTRRPGPRVIAGGTLAVAAVGAAVTLGLTSMGSTPTGGTRVVTDAYTITQSSNGSVLVQINQGTSLPAANHKLTAMGIHEQVIIDMAPGAATVSGPVTCTPAPGVSGPPLKVLVGTDGTETIASGATADNTGEGTWHLAHCIATDDTGNTGVG
jgi:hypothetical protein